MKKFTNLQRKILQLLTNSSGKLDTYTLFKRSRVSFNDFSLALRSLVDRNIINESNNYVLITTKGSVNARNIFLESTLQRKPWRDIPKEIVGTSININAPYIPSMSLLDKSTFNINQEEVD